MFSPSSGGVVFSSLFSPSSGGVTFSSGSLGSSSTGGTTVLDGALGCSDDGVFGVAGVCVLEVSGVTGCVGVCTGVYFSVFKPSVSTVYVTFCSFPSTINVTSITLSPVSH